MAQASTYYDSDYHKGLTWWFTREEIGRGLRELYEVPTELPPKLLALVRKLNAVEGNQLSRRSLIGKLDAIDLPKQWLRHRVFLVAGSWSAGRRAWCTMPPISTRHQPRCFVGMFSARSA